MQSQCNFIVHDNFATGRKKFSVIKCIFCAERRERDEERFIGIWRKKKNYCEGGGRKLFQQRRKKTY